ncbi:class ii aldolase adducin-like protein [Moniliophthora roreri]|nr:class ii aldolase adducin-like protein [Moniliophthora roreri]
MRSLCAKASLSCVSMTLSFRDASSENNNTLIYTAFPNVTSVIHAHTLEVLPFGAIGMGPRAQMGTAASLGTLAPIFDIESPSVKPHSKCTARVCYPEY